MARRPLLQLALPSLAVLLAGCGRLGELNTSPPVTPEQWCTLRPCVDVGGTVLNEPSSTALVFLLAALWVALGVYFLVTARAQTSRRWLGIALVLGGIGAAQAGVSYQAFSYALKCAGRDVCLLTSGWEVGYSITQAVSVSAMLVAVAYACSAGRLRRVLCWYAAFNVVVYLVVSLIGVMVPSRMLLSFEVLLLFALPGIIIVIVLAARRYRADHQPLDRSLLLTAVLLVVVQVAYYAYYAAGITALLWKDGTGIYFSENDVLHVGMILWLSYVVIVVGKHLRDLTQSACRPSTASSPEAQ